MLLINDTNSTFNMNTCICSIPYLFSVYSCELLYPLVNQTWHRYSCIAAAKVLCPGIKLFHSLLLSVRCLSLTIPLLPTVWDRTHCCLWCDSNYVLVIITVLWCLCGEYMYICVLARRLEGRQYSQCHCWVNWKHIINPWAPMVSLPGTQLWMNFWFILGAFLCVLACTSW